MLNINKTLTVGGVGKAHAINLFQFGDMHQDDEGFYGKGFGRMTDDILESPNPVVMQMGDLSDLANTRTRLSLKAANVGGMEKAYKSLDKEAFETQEETIKLCRPFQQHLLFCIRGNHGWEYFDRSHYGESLDLNWSEALDCPISYGLATALLSLKWGTKSATYRVMSRHGVGGARTETGDHNKLEKEMDQYEGVDLFSAGHTHHHYAHKLRPKFIINRSGHIISRNKHVCRTGTFKRNIRNKPLEPSYEEMAGYSPAGLGYIKAKVWLERRQDNGKDILYTQSEVTAVPVD